MSKRLIHLMQGESDLDGKLYTCCKQDIGMNHVRDTKRGITCKKCLNEDKKYV